MIDFGFQKKNYYKHNKSFKFVKIFVRFLNFYLSINSTDA